MNGLTDEYVDRARITSGHREHFFYNLGNNIPLYITCSHVFLVVLVFDFHVITSSHIKIMFIAQICILYHNAKVDLGRTVPRRHSLHEVGLLQTSAQIVTT